MTYELSAAHLSTVVEALDVAAEYRRYRASLTCADCSAHPAELCDSHATDLDRAEEYDKLASSIWETRIEGRAALSPPLPLPARTSTPASSSPPWPSSASAG